MVEILKTIGRTIEKTAEPEAGTWINVVAPTDAEVKTLALQIELDIDSIKAALDEEERAHIELEENHTLIIIDVPIEDRTENTYFYRGVLNHRRKRILSNISVICYRPYLASKFSFFFDILSLSV